MFVFVDVGKFGVVMGKEVFVVVDEKVGGVVNVLYFYLGVRYVIKIWWIYGVRELCCYVYIINGLV